jgi:cell division control protein 11
LPLLPSTRSFFFTGIDRVLDSLREVDIELMRRLSPRVNVIPVIGKADSLTPQELASSKKLIMEDIDHYQIPIYNFPYDVEEDDEETVQENEELRGLMPFAIVGSEDIVEVKGKKIRARVFPWGIVEVDNPRHSDFLAIRSALLHSHLADLKEITHDFLYENYRTEKLSKSVANGAAYLSPHLPTSPHDHYSCGVLTCRDNLNPEDLANQSVRLKEEQLRREEGRLKEIEVPQAHFFVLTRFFS